VVLSSGSGPGSYSFIQQHIRETDPRTILRELLPETVLPPDLDDMTLWQIIINISEPPKRKKRKDVNTLEDVVRLLHQSKRILVLTGAGVRMSSDRGSVECVGGHAWCRCKLSQEACCCCVGVGFLWNTRFSLQRWNLCPARCGLPGPSRPSGHVRHRVLQAGPQTLFQVC